MPVLETERLRLSHLAERDAPFIVDLLNQPTFLQWIGDRGVRNEDDAIDYLRRGPIDSYRQFGFGLYRTAFKQDDTPIGICGLLKREDLDAPDLGYALLPQFCSNGYALEAARAVLDHAWDELNLRRVIALVSPGNVSSVRLLEKLAFVHERTFTWPNEGRETELYARA